jgi:hypothetical protein
MDLASPVVTHPAEHLAKEDHLVVTPDTLRRHLLAAGLWTRVRRRRGYRRRRERKAHFGELLQLDGSFEKWLEERGAKGIILMRFANTTDQGLILANAPIIKGQRIHTIEEFRDLVTSIGKRFKLKVTGTPLWDPEIGSPFAILSEPGLLQNYPESSAAPPQTPLSENTRRSRRP